MKQALKLILIFLSLAAVVACEELDVSYQRRSADPGINKEDLAVLLDETLSRSGSSVAQSLVSGFSGSSETVGGTVVYFAESGFKFGPPEAVVAITDFAPFGLDLPYGTFDIEYARVFYIEGVDPSTLELMSVLVLDLKYFDSESSEVLTFENSGPIEVSNDFYSAVMSGPSGEIVLYSYDLADDYKELAGVIQLKVAVEDGSGDLKQIGRFSTLVGFSL